MSPEVRQLLDDVLRAIYDIESLSGDDIVHLQPRHRMMALERGLIIVGEALAGIRRQDEWVFDQVPHGNAIIGLRNVLVHGYGDVDEARIESLLSDHLPSLKSAILEALGETNR